jgi:peptidyl-prolyl cis-trans isomerase A (cyclophilin A)
MAWKDNQMIDLKKNFALLLVILCISLLLSCSKSNLPINTSLPLIKMTTELGEMIIKIDSINAPITANNFLRYVDEKRFGTASFYRVVRMDNQPNNSIKIEVIQGGLGFDESTLSLPAIAHETTDKTGIPHKDGVISMARVEPGSASSEFFICVGDQPELDFGGHRNPDGQGFAAFGKVIEGMDVVRKIQSQPDEKQMLIEPVKILQVIRLISKKQKQTNI